MDYSRKSTRPERFFSDQITITSESGVGGSSTLTSLGINFLQDRRIRLVGAGAIMRGFAKERGMSIEDFTLYCKNHPSGDYDRRCDAEIAGYGSQNHTVIEGRLPHVFAPHGFHVLLTCPLPVRARRRHRDPEYSQMSIPMIKFLIKKRDQDDKERYEKIYPGCMWPVNHFDLTLGTEILSIDDVTKRIIMAHSQWKRDNRKKIHHGITM